MDPDGASRRCTAINTDRLWPLSGGATARRRTVGRDNLAKVGCRCQTPPCRAAASRAGASPLCRWVNRASLASAAAHRVHPPKPPKVAGARCSPHAPQQHHLRSGGRPGGLGCSSSGSVGAKRIPRTVVTSRADNAPPAPSPRTVQRVRVGEAGQGSARPRRLLSLGDDCPHRRGSQATSVSLQKRLKCCAAPNDAMGHKETHAVQQTVPFAVDTVITVNQHFDELSCFE